MQALSNKHGVVAAEEVVEQKTKGFLRTFAALRHRNFRLFWSGQLISLIGTWMQSTGQAWLVLQLTNSALALGLVGALQFIPVLLFSLFGGVLADRFPKRKVLLITQTSAAIEAAILGLLVLTGMVQLWHVYVFAVLLGITNSIDMPTRQAFVAEMVGRDDLPNAIALNSSLFNMARIVGPGVGGLMIAWLGEAPLFLLNAISFIPVLLGLTMINPKQLHTPARKGNPQDKVSQPGTFQSLREGLRYILRTPAIFLIIAVVGAVSLFGINFNVTLPLFATEVLHSGPAGFGFLSSAFGFGSLISALWLAWRNTKPGITQILRGAIAFGVLQMIFALSHWYWLAVLLIATVGFAQIAFTATANAALQTISPNHLRGRIMSVYMLFFTGSIPLGNLFIGGLAHTFSTPIAILVGSGLAFIAAIIGWLLRAPAEKGVAEYTYTKG
jgi:MFS family permease